MNRFYIYAVALMAVAMLAVVASSASADTVEQVKQDFFASRLMVAQERAERARHWPREPNHEARDRLLEGAALARAYAATRGGQYSARELATALREVMIGVKAVPTVKQATAPYVLYVVESGTHGRNLFLTTHTSTYRHWLRAGRTFALGSRKVAARR
jgi:hypothetical protein